MENPEDFLSPPSSPGRKESPWNWLDVLLICVASAALVVGGSGGLLAVTRAGMAGDQAGQPNSILLSVGLAAVEMVGLIAGVYFLGIRRKGLDWGAAGIRAISARWWRAALVIGAIVIPASGLIALLVQMAMGKAPENPQLEFLAPDGFSWFGLLGMFLLGGIGVPFAEELFFRGVLYQWMRDRLGVWPGILISSIIFGALHGELSVSIAAGVLGIVLAWVFEKSNSLWPGVVIHIVNNAVKIVLLYVMLALGINVT